jgi:hypothetical protein
LVRRDVANAIVSRDAAREVYGVVLGRELEVDQDATHERRGEMRRVKTEASR